MKAALSKTAYSCHINLIEGSFEDLLAWFDQLSRLFECSPQRAREAWVWMGLGQVSAHTEIASNIWFEDPRGRLLLTLSITNGRVWDREAPFAE